jgi:hypothetical protein
LAVAKVAPTSPESQVFHDRLRSAVRGKFGLAEASRLARAGQFEAAIALLRQLILHDPSFADHYRLLGYLQERLERDQRLSIHLGEGHLSVESVINSYRPLWLEAEDSFQPSDDPEQVRMMVEKMAEFLERCEKSLGLTPI